MSFKWLVGYTKYEKLNHKSLNGSGSSINYITTGSSITDISKLMSYDIWALKNLNKYRDSEIMQCFLWRPQYDLPEKLVNQVCTCFLTSCIKCMYVHTRINWTALMNHQKRASIFQVFSCVSKSYKGKIFLKLFSSIYTNLYHISSLQ